jgi:hypothetical protein
LSVKDLRVSELKILEEFNTLEKSSNKSQKKPTNSSYQRYSHK